MEFRFTNPTPEAVAPLLLALHAVHADALPEVFHRDGTLEDMAAHLAGKITAGAVLLGADIDGVLAGYALYQTMERPRDAFRHAQRSCCLDHLYVALRFRKRGLATGLIREMEARLSAAGIQDWYATHHAFNADVARVFAAVGAEPLVHKVGRSI